MHAQPALNIKPGPQIRIRIWFGNTALIQGRNGMQVKLHMPHIQVTTREPNSSSPDLEIDNVEEIAR